MTFDTETELRAFMQPIVDAAAQYGITAGNQAAEVKATAEHLKDLRELIFKRLLPTKDGDA
jgi:hypothetical protein